MPWGSKGLSKRASTVISAFNSLTLSPALAAVLLKGHDAPKDRFSRLLDRLFGGWLRPSSNSPALDEASPVKLRIS